MKIVFLARLFSPHFGGVEKHVLEVSKILVKKGHKVTVITELIENTKTKEEKDGIVIYRIAVGGDDWFKKFRVWKKIWGLRKVILDADVVHCHDVFFWYLPFRFLFWREPVYETFHGFEGYPIRKKAILVRRVWEKLAWGNICIGDYLKKWFGTKPTLVLYGGIDKMKYKNNQVKPLPVVLTIVMLARLEPDIGVESYIKLLRYLQEKKVRFTFIAVGDGSLRQEVAQFGKVTGFVTDIDRWLNQADIVFASSYLSTLESLSFGKLVVTVYETPIKRDCYALSPFGKSVLLGKDPRKLGEQLIAILENDTRRKQLLESSYEWLQRQTWDDITEAYLQLWQRRLN